MLLSIVIPVHNEAPVLPLTHQRLTVIGPQLAERGLSYEIVFVNDGSTDGSDNVLDALARRDPQVAAVHLTRNFGQQAAISAGLATARGAAVAIMDADLQDPPELLPEMLDRWRDGFQVVYAVRRKRDEVLWKRMGFRAYYTLLGLLSEVDMPADSGSFCVMDRVAVDLLNQLPERQRFVPGLRAWIGLKQTGVMFDRPQRQAGTASVTLRSLTRLGIDGLVGFSAVPLRLVTRLGIGGLLATIPLAAYVLISLLFGSNTPRGWASLACLIVLGSSVQLLCLGIMGEYVARVFVEVKGRPTYLVARVTGGTDAGQVAASSGGVRPIRLAAEPREPSVAQGAPRL